MSDAPVSGPTALPLAFSPRLLADLKAAEGCRTEAYQDTLGIWTIGYGHAHVAPGTVWTQAECEATLLTDIGRAMVELDAHLPWWRRLDPVRRDALTELMFNMGPGDRDHGLLSFRNTLAAIERGDYGLAATGLLASRWARQVGPTRSGRIAAMIRTGAQPGSVA